MDAFKSNSFVLTNHAIHWEGRRHSYENSTVSVKRHKLGRMQRRAYYDAEPWYQREQTRDWYQQMEITNGKMKAVLDAHLDMGSTALLEVACGGGWFAEHLLSRGISRYSGFDFAETAVKNAQARIGKYSNAQCFRGDALDSRSYGAGINAILAHQFLHCLVGEDRKRWFSLCAGSLSESRGLLIFSSMYGIPDSLKETIDPLSKVNHPGNRYYAELAEIRTEVAESGFAVIHEDFPERNELIVAARYTGCV